MDHNISAAPKSEIYHFRINPEVKRQVEEVYAKNGLSFTQAINVFIQQSLNVGGFPYRYLIVSKQIVFYEVIENTIEIIRVLDARTDYLSVLFTN